MNQYKPLSTQERVAPFLALLEARYAPLLCAVAPQSYAVFLWLWEGSNATWAAFIFSILGALGYEAVYVGAIAWTLEGRKSRWTWATSLVALGFSVLVAGYVYFDTQGWWALLHSGFPLVGFCYTMALHSQQEQARQDAIESPQPVALPIAPPAPIALSTPQPAIKPSAAPSELIAVAPAADSNPLLDWLMEDEIAETEERPGDGLPIRAQVYAILDKRKGLKNEELYALMPGKNQGGIRAAAADHRNGVPLKKPKAAALSHNGNGRH